MRTTSRVAALTLSLSVGLAALTACSDDDPPAADPSPTWSPTGKLETPTSPAAEPVEPELPVAATQATEAGARAFIAYYWELINYAQVTGDVKALKAVSGTSCDGCSKGVAIVQDLYAAGGRAIGGEYELTVTKVKQVESPDKSLKGMEARYSVRNAKQTVVHGDGSTEVMTPATTEYLSYLIWLNGAWRTDVLEPQ